MAALLRRIARAVGSLTLPIIRFHVASVDAQVKSSGSVPMFHVPSASCVALNTLTPYPPYDSILATESITAPCTAGEIM